MANATLHTNHGAIEIELYPERRAQDRRELRDPCRQGLLRRRHLPPRDPGLHDPGRRPDRHRHAAAPATSSRTSSTTTRSTAARWRWRTPARTRTAASSSSSRPTRARGSTASTPSSVASLRHGRRRRDLGGRDATHRDRPREDVTIQRVELAQDVARGAVAPSGDRRSSQNPASSAGPIVTAKTTVPIPTVPPSANPAASASDLDPRPDDARAVGAVRAPSTTMSESRGPAPIQAPRYSADAIPKSGIAIDEQGDPHAERVLGEPVDHVDRGQHLDEQRRRGRSSRPSRTRSSRPSAQATASTTSPTTTLAAPNESGVCFAIPWWSMSHGESPSSDSSWQTIPSAKRNSPSRRATDRRGEPAADARRHVHRPTLTLERSARPGSNR